RGAGWGRGGRASTRHACAAPVRLCSIWALHARRSLGGNGFASTPPPPPIRPASGGALRSAPASDRAILIAHLCRLPSLSFVSYPSRRRFGRVSPSFSPLASLARSTLVSLRSARSGRACGPACNVRFGLEPLSFVVAGVGYDGGRGGGMF